MHSKAEVSVQKLAAFVGMKTAAKQAVRVAPLFYRHLQALINKSSAPGIILRGSETELPSSSRDIERGLTGIRVVDARNAELQQSPFACGSTRSSDGVRCISFGLGSNLKRSGSEDRQSVVNQRTKDAYQLSRTTSSISGNSDFCQGEAEYQYFSEDRQCIGQGIHKLLWRDPLMADESLSHADMEVVYRAANIPNSRAPSRNNESDSRRGVEDSEGLV